MIDALVTLTSPLPIVARVQWECPDGAASPSWPVRTSTPTHIMIHHSAMETGPSSGVEAVQEIWSLHALERGWGDVGYHFLIDPAGRIYEGRCGGAEAVGAHFKGGNEGTIGICLLGNFMTDIVPESALNALVHLLAILTVRLKIPPCAARLHRQRGLVLPTICGHRDGNPATLCPGDALYERLSEVNQRVALGTDRSCSTRLS